MVTTTLSCLRRQLQVRRRHLCALTAASWSEAWRVGWPTADSTGVITPQSAPWAFRRDGESSRLIATLEALGPLLALMAFGAGLEREARHQATQLTSLHETQGEREHDEQPHDYEVPDVRLNGSDGISSGSTLDTESATRKPTPSPRVACAEGPQVRSATPRSDQGVRSRKEGATDQKGLDKFRTTLRVLSGWIGGEGLGFLSEGLWFRLGGRVSGPSLLLWGQNGFSEKSFSWQLSVGSVVDLTGGTPLWGSGSESGRWSFFCLWCPTTKILEF